MERLKQTNYSAASGRSITVQSEPTTNAPRGGELDSLQSKFSENSLPLSVTFDYIQLADWQCDRSQLNQKHSPLKPIIHH